MNNRAGKMTAERNALIYRHRFVRADFLASLFGLSRTRVQQIIKQERRKADGLSLAERRKRTRAALTTPVRAKISPSLGGSR